MRCVRCCVGLQERTSCERRICRAIVQRYFDRLLNQHDLSVCDEVLAPAYVDHDVPPDTPPGSSSTKAFVAALIDDFPDIQVRIEDMLAETNTVAARMVWKGVHRHSGATLHQTGILIVRLNDQGQIAERWSAYTTIADDQRSPP
jgi:predicted SnoaL-like aldol condensation-catalyzing enzyme